MTSTCHALLKNAALAALLVAGVGLFGRPALAAVDLDALWDFRQPALSEQRFRAALADARGDEALLLQTQIARSHGLRGDFSLAREVLARAVAPQLAQAGTEVQVRYWLELGRSWSSATHPPASQTDAARAQARAAWLQALALARAGGLDALAVDCLHMLAFVDTAPADQQRWTEEALALASTSAQPAARRWEASLRNNLGMALHGKGRYDEALQQFQQALALREARGQAGAARVAKWMVAWTLRAMARTDEALSIQLQLAEENRAAGTPDPHVFAELAQLYRGLGQTERAEHFARQQREAERAAATP